MEVEFIAISPCKFIFNFFNFFFLGMALTYVLELSSGSNTWRTISSNCSTCTQATY